IEESDDVTTVSRYLEERTATALGVKRPIRVIYNFVNLELYRRNTDPKARAVYAGPGEKVLVHLSNFRPVKRVADAVRVMARVRRGVPAELMMIGERRDRGRAEMLARELGIGDDVLFLGKQNRVPELLALADV